MTPQDQGFVIAVVDDDDSIREAIVSLLRSVGLDSKGFTSAEEFLNFPDGDTAGCLILDVQLPGMSGPDLQRTLAEYNRKTPIVFITAQEDRGGQLRAQSLALGAAAFLRKPFDHIELLDAVRSAFEGRV